MSSKAEDDYFLKKDLERRRKLALEAKQKTLLEDHERLKAEHWMRCAKCGFEMETLVFRGVEIERCFQCGGTYLDDGELEKLAGEESTLIHSIVGLFKSSEG